MAAVEEDKEFQSGIPNEAFLPHLHVITFRRNHTLINNQVLPKQNATEDYVK
jgi:hypothetical protein